MNDAITWRTSTTDPLWIDSVAVPGTTARIGMTLCPGKTYPWGRHGAWRRDLATDLTAIRDWGAHTLISLIEPYEFETLGITELPDAARAAGLDWRHWPIADQEPPDARFEAHWNEQIAEIAARLRAGSHIVLHCMGGLGRTGTVAACLLVFFGLSPEAAVAQVRAARRGAIETDGQLQYVLAGREGCE